VKSESQTKRDPVMEDPSLVHAGTTELARRLSIEEWKWKPYQAQDNHVKQLL
jgi:hypothetical protein